MPTQLTITMMQASACSGEVRKRCSASPADARTALSNPSGRNAIPQTTAETLCGIAIGLAGIGASTLPAALFDRFPRLGTCEIHLATEFQNMIFDHPSFPAVLKRDIYDRLRSVAADERKPSDTDEQFFYKTRKKALGLYKRELWGMPAGTRAAIGAALEEKFRFLLEKLAVGGTRALAARHAPFVPGSFPASGSAMAATRGHEDVSGLSD